MKIGSILTLLIGKTKRLTAVSPENVKLETIRNAFKKLPVPSKRIFVDFEEWDPTPALQTPAGLAIRKIILRDAEAIMPLSPCQYVVYGRRLEVSRQIMLRVNTLAMAWKLTGEEKYARRGIDEMLSTANFPDWQPSHFLDTGEMSVALATGYAWLYPVMTEAERETIAAALWEKGVKMSIPDNPDGKKINAQTWWINAENNWAQVCHAGMIAAALASGDRDPELAAQIIHRAIVNLPLSMRASFSPNGAYPEGPNYWGYGTGYTCLALGLLEHAFGTDFGLSQIPGWSTTGNFISHAIAPSGLAYNYSDGSAEASPELAWFFLEAHYPGTIPLTGSILQKFIDSGNQEAQVKESQAYQMFELQGNRTRPLELLWLKPQNPKTERQRWFFSGMDAKMPLAMFRSDWSENAMYLGIKGGGTKMSHAHMDGGSFILEADGVRWVCELGAEAYHPLEARGMDLWNWDQDSDRWKIFRLGADSHNILRIDGAPQWGDGWGKIVDIQTKENKPLSVTLDLSTLSRDIKTHIRTAEMAEKTMAIRDELTGVHPGAKVRFQFCTFAKPEISGNTVILREKDKSMKVTAAPGVVWETAPTSRWMKEWDSDNGSACMVWFEVTSPADGNVSMKVDFIPGSVDFSVSRCKLDKNQY